MNIITTLLVILLLISCNSNHIESNKEKKMNDGAEIINPFLIKPSDLSKLENDIQTSGDTAKYLRVRNHYFSMPQYDKLFYYSIIMANRYNYNSAFYDVYIELTHHRTGESFNEIGEGLQNLALYYLLKSYELGFSKAIYDIKDIIGEKKPFPSSSYYLKKLSLNK